MNERDATTPAAAGNGSHLSVPHITPTTPHVHRHTDHPVTTYTPTETPTNNQHTFIRRKRTTAPPITTTTSPPITSTITHHHRPTSPPPQQPTSPYPIPTTTTAHIAVPHHHHHTTTAATPSRPHHHRNLTTKNRYVAAPPPHPNQKQRNDDGGGSRWVAGGLGKKERSKKHCPKTKNADLKMSLHHRRLSHRRQIWTVFRWCGESIEESHHTTTHLELHGE